eukprot:6196141-Pleurochrysis_carterae.AAC.5
MRPALHAIHSCAAARAVRCAAFDRGKSIMPAVASTDARAVATKAAVGFSFSPGGLLFPYFIGIGYSLLSAGAIDSRTPLGGSSAGSIVAGALACGVDKTEVRRGLSELAANVRNGQTLNSALRLELDRLLPDDAPERAEGRLKVCYRQVFPWPKSFEVTKWDSKQDLINTICASCNWPFFFSRWPLVWVRRGLAVDGFFTQPMSRFGCPALDADRTVLICSLPRMEVKADQGDLIQPGVASFSSPPFSDGEWFSYAMAPASEETFDQIIELGEEHGQQWLRQEGHL